MERLIFSLIVTEHVEGHIFHAVMEDFGQVNPSLRGALRRMLEKEDYMKLESELGDFSWISIQDGIRRDVREFCNDRSISIYYFIMKDGMEYFGWL